MNLQQKYLKRLALKQANQEKKKKAWNNSNPYMERPRDIKDWSFVLNVIRKRRLGF